LLGFLVRRTALSFIALLFLLTLVFILVRAVPGDPARFRAGIGATREQVEQARRELGLDEPQIVQYALFLKNLFLHADLGMSVVTNQPVLKDLAERIPTSLELAFVSYMIGLLFGIPIGAVAAIKWNTWVDHSSRLIGLAGVAVPTFWLGLLLQIAFYKHLGWFPIAGKASMSFYGAARITNFVMIDSLITGDLPRLADYLWHMVLPAFCLSQGVVALCVRMFRSSLLEVLSKPYISTARSKGLREFRVVAKHAAKNALIPIVSLSGVYFGLMVGNAILIETIFSWPGIGTYIVKAISSFDYPGILGSCLVIGIVFLLANLVSDLLHAVIDPALRYD